MHLFLKKSLLRCFSSKKFEEIQSKFGISTKTIESLSSLTDSLITSNLSEAEEGSKYLSRLFSQLSPTQKLASAAFLPSLAQKLDSQGLHELAKSLYLSSHDAYKFKLSENLSSYYITGIEAASISLKLDDFPKAEEVLMELLKSCKMLTNKKLLGIFYEVLGRLRYNQGKTDDAIQYLEMAEATLSKFNEDHDLSLTLASLFCQLGDLYCFKNEFAKAKERMTAGIYFFIKSEEIDLEALSNMHAKLCEINFQLGEVSEIFNVIKMMEDIFSDEKNQTQIISNFFTGVANKVIEIGKDYKTCFKVQKAYLDFVLKNNGEKSEIASQAYAFVAEKYLEKNKFKEAVIHAEHALDIQKKLNNQHGQVLALNLLASIYLKIGDLELVEEFFREVSNLLLVYKNDELETLHKQNLAGFHAYCSNKSNK